MKLQIVLLVLAVFIIGAVAEAEESELRVAVLTGGHGFEEGAFLDVFEAQKDIAYTHIPLNKRDGFLEEKDIADYDVFVLYNMSAKITESQKAAFLKCLELGKGFVILHHAIANYPQWPLYPEIINARYFLAPAEWRGKPRERSEYTHDVQVPVHVEDPKHPITQGLDDFTIHDEVYRKWCFISGARVLLTTEHPESGKEICWVRDFANSKVCFLQLGHGPEAYANPSFRRVVARAIQWSAGRDPEV